MERIVYIDCFSGASGDMMLGALLDLGLPIEELRRALGSLAIEYGEIAAERVLRAGVSATKLRLREPAAVGAASHVRREAGAGARAASPRRTTSMPQPGIIRWPTSPPRSDARRCRRRARRAPCGCSNGSARRRRRFMRRRSSACTCTKSVRSIRSSTSSAPCTGWSGSAPIAIVASPLNVGSGTVQCAHGTFPVPAPATLRLLAGVPIYGRADRRRDA